jgi:hypothetical protein
MRLGIQRLAQRRILLVVYNLIEERVHEDDDLYVLLDSLLEYILLGLENRIALLILRLDEIRIPWQELIVQSTTLAYSYVLM